MVGIIFCIIFGLIAIGSFGFGVKKCIDLVKDKRSERPLKEYNKVISICAIVFSISIPVLFMFSFLALNYTAHWDEYLKAIFGGLVLGLSLSVGTFTFIIHYYAKKLPENVDKKLFWLLMASVALITPGLLVGLDCFSSVQGEGYVLPNGLSFQYGFVSPKDALSGKTPNIAFYAICILFGAVFVYLLCDHFHYKKYGKHGMLDSTFLIAFPAGILGARFAYVIGNWNGDGHTAAVNTFAYRVAHGEWWSIFAIWEGGLTILGGAIVGIVVGVLWYMHKNKGKSIWWAVDVIVPTILIAQALGRWGNFFNCEVHGGQVPIEYWRWLPNFIVNNSKYSSSHGFAADGMIYAPLFIIEAMTNVLGYFVLAHLFGKKLNKITCPGDLAFGYLIWYGFTRALMEPIRDSAFNMGQDGYWSWFWSVIFIAGGSLLILINHIVRKSIAIKKGETSEVKLVKTNISLGVFAVIGIALIVTGTTLMSVKGFEATIALNQFNVGLILLVTGITFFLFISLPIIDLVHKYQTNKKVA